jgi:hypothetical protein
MGGDLMACVDAQAARPLPPAAAACATALRARFGSSTVGILFYGAGLRQPVAADTLLDFYAVVDDPRVALRNVFAGTAAMILPPNVYLIEVPTSEGPRRAKVAVIGARAFRHGMTAFSSHLWGRFAQPAAIAYARDGNARGLLQDALCAAVRTFIAETLPLMDDAFTARALWLRGLTECYRSELRPELSRAPDLVDIALPYYEAVTAAVLGQPSFHGLYPFRPNLQRARHRWAWRRRSGKTTNLLRLMKAAFTFKGGLDYAVAKIARHTGVVVEISDTDRRHPLLAGIRVFLEARRRGGVR